MCSTTEGYDCKQSDTYREEVREMQGQRDACKSGSAQNLSCNDNDSLVRHKLKKRTPEKFQCPREHDDRCPQRNLAVRDTESLEHQYAHHIENDEWETHGKICRRNPFQRGFSGNVFVHKRFRYIKQKKPEAQRSR